MKTNQMLISKETRLEELGKTLPVSAGYLLHGNRNDIDVTPTSKTLASMAAIHGISEAQIETFVLGLNAMLMEKNIIPPRHRD